MTRTYPTGEPWSDSSQVWKISRGVSDEAELAVLVAILIIALRSTTTSSRAGVGRIRPATWTAAGSGYRSPSSWRTGASVTGSAHREASR